MIKTHHLSRRAVSLALLASGLLTLTARAEGPDAMQLLAASDLARGGGLTGLVWEVQAVNSGSGAEDQVNQRLRIKAVDSASVAEVLDPPNSKGAKTLQVDRNMWMTKPGLRKPIAISPRQRLSGQAAIGDVAATNYAKDYSAEYLREETINGEPCHVLDLRANSRQTTYDRITYWVSDKRKVAVRAEFLSLTGKRLKSAEFVYGNSISFKGQTIPFVSEMVISDALTDAKTALSYSHVKAQAVPQSEFDVANLQ